MWGLSLGVPAHVSAGLNIKIERVGHADRDRVAPLFDAYRQYYSQAPDLERARQFIGARLTQDQSVILLATQDDDEVGFAQLYPSYSSVRTTKIWILNDLYVAPQARRMGVARALLLAARNFAIENEAHGLILETTPDNAPAQALYHDLGWELDGTLHYQLVLGQVPD